MANEEPTSPFENIPVFGDLAKLMGKQKNEGPIDLATAKHFAYSVATEGEPEPNVDPMQRIRLEELAHIAELHVNAATGIPLQQSSGPLQIQSVNKTTWVNEIMDAYSPYFLTLAETLDQKNHTDASEELDVSADPFASFLGPMISLLGPTMLGLTVGSLIGHLAQHNFGVYDIPVPQPLSNTISIITRNIAIFGDDWSIPDDDILLWVCIHEIIHHTILQIPHIHTYSEHLLQTYLKNFQTDSSGFAHYFEHMDPEMLQSNPSALTEFLSDPEVLLGVVRSKKQQETIVQIQTFNTILSGYVDHIMDKVGSKLISNYSMVTEAFRRRRAQHNQSSRFVERLLGIEMSAERFDLGTAFIAGVLERSDEDALIRLWESVLTLPTPAEVEAPGLWLARLEMM